MGDTKKRKLLRSFGDLKRANMSTGDPVELETQIHILLSDGREIVKSQAELIATGVDSALGISEAGRRSAEKRRRKNEPLTDSVLRLQAADPPLTPGEIIDKLMPRYGGEYDLNDGDEYERKRDSFGRKIRRIKSVAKQR